MRRTLLLLGAWICLESNRSFGQAFSSSNLPIVVITTGGQNIDTPYQKYFVDMGVIDNGPGMTNYLSDPYNNYLGEVEVELHGSSSLWLPKKSYNIETVNSAHQKVKVSLMGMPAESDWVFNAPYQDKTLIRDALSFRLFNKMGHYSSRSRFFELVVDGNYRGVYELQEKVKRNPFRVDVSKLKPEDVVGDDLTGGYIIKIDKFELGEEGWYSNYNSNASNDSANYFLYHYPNPDSMPVVQKEYIKNFFHTFESVLVSPTFSDPVNGYPKYLDVSSFIDIFLMNEMSKNVDGYRASSYFYKDKDSKGGKLHCGPVWDFDLAWWNSSYNGGNIPWGWQYQQASSHYFVPFWWWQFMSDTSFKNQLKCRYESLRSTVLSFPSIYSYIDSIAYALDEPQERNFTRWPILGTAIYPNPTPVPPDYAGEIGALKTWIDQRLTWLDANMPGVCTLGTPSQPSVGAGSLQAYPNPFTNGLSIYYHVPANALVQAELLNMLGERIQTISHGYKASGFYEEEIDVDDLAEGVYVIRMKIGQGTFYQKVIRAGQ